VIKKAKLTFAHELVPPERMHRPIQSNLLKQQKQTGIKRTWWKQEDTCTRALRSREAQVCDLSRLCVVHFAVERLKRSSVVSGTRMGQKQRRPERSHVGFALHIKRRLFDLVQSDARKLNTARA